MFLRLFALLMWITASFSAQAEGVRAHAFAGLAPAAAECVSPESGDAVDHCANVCVAGSDLIIAAGSVLQPLETDQPAALPALIPAIADVKAQFSAIRPGRVVAHPLRSAHLRDLSGVRLLI